VPKRVATTQTAADTVAVLERDAVAAGLEPKDVEAWLDRVGGHVVVGYVTSQRGRRDRSEVREPLNPQPIYVIPADALPPG
jgi:hypothetical protein